MCNSISLNDKYSIDRLVTLLTMRKLVRQYHKYHMNFPMDIGMILDSNDSKFQNHYLIPVK